MAVRRSILTNMAARNAFVEGVKRLKAEDVGLTTAQLGIPGPTQPVSTYDSFVVWHSRAMDEFTPPTQGDRNAAHRGPVFLPWHRYMLILLEAQLQRVLADPNFGLPYWDWAKDGELAKVDQPKSNLWKATWIGGNGDPTMGDAIADGPFSDAAGWRVKVASDSNGILRSVDRPLRRSFDVALGLPRKADVGQALARTSYDLSPWNPLAAGLRNRAEGWVPAASAPHLHNRVHVWVGGDMLPASSPNDPVFYLNHCNVDRIWAAWQKQRPTAPYRPAQTAPQSLFRHRVDDPLYSIFAAGTNGPPINQMLDVSSVYTYGSLAVA
jgi:tyrosinase